jgi:N-acetylglucosamine kinase-like BadF-type ATPase
MERRWRNAEARLVLGVEGDAQQTLAVALDLAGPALHIGRSGPSNVDSVGAQSAVHAVEVAADAAVAHAGCSAGDVASAVIAISGTETASLSAHFGKSMARTGSS